jgi:transposase
MDTFVERCAGLDVHKDLIAACVRLPGERGKRTIELHEFSATTEGLLALRDWLVGHGVTLVGMEATDVIWGFQDQQPRSRI